MNASTLGTAVPQVTARSKVMGRALYAGDVKVAGMLHAKVLRSPYPHARIVRIDTSAALALPGVKAVLTGADAPRAMWGVHHKERRILAEGVVRFAGEEVAAVAAVTEEVARDALDLIEVEYEELPAILTTEEALDEEAPGVHPGRNNVSHEIKFHIGDVDAALAQADLVYEATYDCHAQYPGYLEPMATVATIDADGRLQVWTSTQSVFLARMRLAAALEMPASGIRVMQATTGGGFGGKIVEDANNLIAGLLAVKTAKPVRLVNNRLEDFQACCSSVPERVTLKLGMTKEGIIIAKDVRIIAECGAYSGLSAEVMHVTAMRSDNMHRLQNVRSHATLVYTNNPPHGAFRGFGGAQMQFALNSHIHMMAEKLGLDPAEVHKRNALNVGETSIHGWKIGSTGLRACIDQCTEAIQWQAKRAAKAPGRGSKRRGVGMAAAMHVSGNRTIGNWDGSTVVVKVNEDGRVLVHSGECDMGQGAMTMLSQVVAHELNIPLDHVHVVAPDTDVSPYAIGSLASRVTITAGNAAILAGRKAREALLKLAAEQLQEPAERLEIAEGFIRVQGQPVKQVTLAEVARLHIWRHDGEGLQVSATWDPKTVMHGDVHGNVAPAHSYAAQAVEVEVDTETGQVTVVDSFVSDDCGKAFNPLAVHGQSNGAAAQAMGWALYEQLQMENGRLVNGNFADYTMPTADSIPLLRSGIVESNDPNGPYGAKGASETAILPGAPAIANAVYDAIGVRITDLPITPEKVLAGLRELKSRQQEGARHA
ncbi:MAG: xanthine dehydrogenase family protein molybdopterin-binding subunit [Pigmentiphaga sp.]|uniref:xanthine dehydrogenase family protein molybdopterin-binding subunit n=1 Tax=Pigmentiphaga sp. TaxID=1977564 RepID=UPI0029A5E6D1|nr:xanthine dehydrogenase family protein molybdopterin-binding subunit [Pigmentiphaga sp.]MDX3905973.1 xanthine dehydrogenase family protein molybdopterin-binding subunit [Pigmentiphaga sp.]